MKEREACLKEKLGCCSGCNIIEIAILQLRWAGLSMEEAKKSIEDEYCPEGVKPDDLKRHSNREAGLAFGQRRGENVEFDQPKRRPLKKKVSKGVRHGVMSKKTTGRFFREEVQIYAGR